MYDFIESVWSFTSICSREKEKRGGLVWWLRVRWMIVESTKSNTAIHASKSSGMASPERKARTLRTPYAISHSAAHDAAAAAVSADHSSGCEQARRCCFGGPSPEVLAHKHTYRKELDA